MVTVGISLVRALVEEVDRTGHDGRALLKTAGIDATILENPEARVETDPYDLLQQLALRATGDPALGLHMGEHASIAAFSLPGHMVAQCGTLRETLDVLFRYHRLVADAAPPRLVEDGDQARIIYEIVRSQDPLCNRLRTEFGLTRMLLMSRAFVGFRDAHASEVWFEHAPPPYAAEYTRIFSGQERFERPHAGFAFSRELLDARQMHHDARLFRILRGEAEQWLERLETDEGIAGKIRRMIVELFPNVPLELDGIARRLGMSSRSLRRRLQQEGQSLQIVVGTAMRDLACSMLRERNVTIQETAHRLGFSEPSAFHRAFKRWTGVTPAEWRRALDK